MSESDIVKTDIIPELHVVKEPKTDDMDEKIALMRQALEEFPAYIDNPDIHSAYSDDDIIRFLRARNFDLVKAKTMILEECAWRATFQPHLLCANDEIEAEIRTGKNRIGNYPDRHGRPVIIMNAKYENTTNYDSQLKLLVWQLERARKLMIDPVSKYTVVIKMEGVGMFNGPPSHVTKEVAKTLSDRYPERLGTAIILGAGTAFKIAYTLVSPFLDSRTKNKIKFLPENILPGSNDEKVMMDCLGKNWKKIAAVGAEQVDPQTAPGYDHETYWPRVLAQEKTGKFYLSDTEGEGEVEVEGDVEVEVEVEVDAKVDIITQEVESLEIAEKEKEEGNADEAEKADEKAKVVEETA